MNLRGSFGGVVRYATIYATIGSLLGGGMALSSSACIKPDHVEPAHVAPTQASVAPLASLAPRSPLSVTSSEPGERRAPEAPKPFTSWIDPAAAEALLRGNAWPREGDDALTCVFESPEQSCIPGSDAVRFGCVQECNSTCVTCGKECTPKLELCRATCTKDSTKSASEKHACELACAHETGRCLDGCVTSRDRCRTGECNAEVDKYQKRVSSNYGCKLKANPLAICTKARACLDTCKDDACEANCLRKHAPGCDQGFQDAVKMSACQVFDTSI
jgi:hypothetical protein